MLKLFIKATPILLSIFFFGLFLWQWNEKRELSKELINIQHRMSETSNSANGNFFEALLEADNEFFVGKNYEAQLQYSSLLTDEMYDEKTELINMRLQYLDKMRAERQQSPDIVELNLNVLKKDSTQRRGVADSAKTSHRKQVDSLQEQLSTMNRRIRNRDRALEQKEQTRMLEFNNVEGRRVKYVGETKNGKANGNGTGVWESSGGVYKGEWKENMRHGHGDYTWSDGEHYEGDFFNDQREGKGVYTWPSGERYEGYFQKNRRNGEGTLYDGDGNISFQGVWKDDKPSK